MMLHAQLRVVVRELMLLVGSRGVGLLVLLLLLLLMRQLLLRQLLMRQLLMRQLLLLLRQLLLLLMRQLLLLLLLLLKPLVLLLRVVVLGTVGGLMRVCAPKLLKGVGRPEFVQRRQNRGACGRGGGGIGPRRGRRRRLGIRPESMRPGERTAHVRHECHKCGFGERPGRPRELQQPLVPLPEFHGGALGLLRWRRGRSGSSRSSGSGSGNKWSGLLSGRSVSRLDAATLAERYACNTRGISWCPPPTVRGRSCCGRRSFCCTGTCARCARRRTPWQCPC
jgi:hypothetical protein